MYSSSSSRSRCIFNCVWPQPRVLAHVAAAKTKILAPADHLFDQPQQAPRLRRQLVERAAQQLVHQAVGVGDVLARGLDVGEPCAVFTGRWCWCSSAIARISVRYFM